MNEHFSERSEECFFRLFTSVHSWKTDKCDRLSNEVTVGVINLSRYLGKRYHDSRERIENAKERVSLMKYLLIDRDPEFAHNFLQILQGQMLELGMQYEGIEVFPETEKFSIESVRKGTEVCVVTEMIPGVIDGLQLAQKIRDVNERVPIVLCTSTNDYGMQCYDLDITYYLLKPVSEASVKMMLKRIQKRLREWEV